MIKTSTASLDRLRPGTLLPVLLAVLTAVLAVNALLFVVGPGDGGSGIGGTGRMGGESGLGGTGSPAPDLGALAPDRDEESAPGLPISPPIDRHASPEAVPRMTVTVDMDTLRLTPERSVSPVAENAGADIGQPPDEIDRLYKRRDHQGAAEVTGSVTGEAGLEYERRIAGGIDTDLEGAVREVVTSSREVTRRLILVETITALETGEENGGQRSESGERERHRLNLPNRPERPDRPDVRRVAPAQRGVPAPPVRPMRI